MRKHSLPLRDDDAIDTNAAIQFWQKEVHYYEGRAGEQGRSASSLVTVAAGTTAVIPLIATTANWAPTSNGLDARVLLLGVPLVILLLWTSAIRLLHEMQLLRIYVQHAETHLEALTRTQPTLRAYQSWALHGGRHDMPFVLTLVWLVPAGILSLAGTFGITALVVAPAIGEYAGLAYALLAVAGVLLVYSFVETSRDAAAAARELGLTLPARQSGWTWRRIAFWAALFAILASAPVVIGLVIGGEAAIPVLAWLYFGEAVAGVAVGLWAGHTIVRNRRSAVSRVLTASALLGIAAAGAAAVFGAF